MNSRKLSRFFQGSNWRQFAALFIACATLTTLSPLQAATWKGGASSDWTNPELWDPPSVPSGNEPIVIPSGTPAVPDGSTFFDLTISGGTVSGTFDVTGRFEWSGGALTSGTTTLRPGATLLLDGNSAKSLNGHVLINQGTVEWIGSGLVNGNDQSEFRNDAGGKVQVKTAQGNTGFRHVSGNPSRFVNLGDISKTGGDTLFDLRAFFDHQGSLNVETGRFLVHNGGNLKSKMTASSGAQIVLDNGNFTLEGELEVENIVLDGGEYGGTSSLKGSSTWISGTFERSNTTIPTGSVLTISDPTTKSLDEAVIINAGTVRWIVDGVINANNASAITNQPGATVELQSERAGQIRNVSGLPSTFHNAGAITKSGRRERFDMRIRFNNSATGTVSIDSGELRFEDGGLISGKWTASSDADLRLFNGEFDVEGEVMTDGLEFAGGTFSGEHMLRGSSVWTGGTFLGGKTTIPRESLLEVVDAGSKIIDDHEIENSGRIVLSSPGTFIANNGSVVRNLTDGRFQIDVAVNHVLRTDRGATGTFENQGSFQKSGGAVNTDLRWNFQNSGQVRVASGNLRFQSDFKQTDGEFLLEGATTSASNGFNLEGGLLHGAGTVEGGVLNGGTVSPGSNVGLLTITGDYTQNPSGSLMLHIAGLNPGTEHDRLEVSGKTLLGGSIVVSFTSGFKPATGNRFEVMTYQSQTGTPALIDVTQALDAEFGPTALTLITAREPIIIEPFSLSIAPSADNQFEIMLQGQADQPYTIEATTDLVNWVEVFSTDSAPDATIEFVDTPPENISHRIYRATTP